MRDSDTVAAEGDLTVTGVFVLFQWFSAPGKDAEDSHCRALTKYQYRAQGLAVCQLLLCVSSCSSMCI